MDVDSFLRDGFVAVRRGRPFAGAGHRLRRADRPGRVEVAGQCVGGAMMVRFLSEDRAGAGYHIEASYPSPDGQRWLVNVRSRARGLLALFLLTDVGPGDAPARLVCGSHLTAARFLESYGEAATDADADLWYPSTLCRPNDADFAARAIKQSPGHG